MWVGDLIPDGRRGVWQRHQKKGQRNLSWCTWRRQGIGLMNSSSVSSKCHHYYRHYPGFESRLPGFKSHSITYYGWTPENRLNRQIHRAIYIHQIRINNGIYLWWLSRVNEIMYGKASNKYLLQAHCVCQALF